MASARTFEIDRIGPSSVQEEHYEIAVCAANRVRNGGITLRLAREVSLGNVERCKERGDPTDDRRGGTRIVPPP